MGIYLKEGNSDYASINPQNYCLVIHFRATGHHPFELLPYQSQSSMDLSSWMLKGSILTFSLNSERIPFQAEHLNIQSEPWTLDPDGLLRNSRCIYVLDSRNLQLCVSPVSHNHLLAGNFSQTKPLHQVHMHYYWPGLPSYVKDYCRSCTICSMPNLCATNLMDFSNNFDSQEALEFHIHGFHREAPSIFQLHSILVIVDHRSKQSLFIPTHDTIHIPQLAQLFILHIFSKHGVPSHITSECGMELYPTSSSPSELHWTWSYTSLPDIILKVMDKPMN